MKANDVARALAARAEAVCRAYLPAGRRAGNYWQVGDVHGHPGQSLYVRLTGSRAGSWTDSATGEYGDLLDLIAVNRGLDFFGAMEEAHAFLSEPWPAPDPVRQSGERDTVASARRLFAAARPITGTLAERYLAGRGIVLSEPEPALRFHPRVWCRPTPDAPLEARPALIAAVTDGDGAITGVHRTFLDPDTAGKAAMPKPRRALGRLLGNAVRFGDPGDALVAGEGIESVLTLRMLFPGLSMVAALSAGHLGAFALPPGLIRLYIALEPDPAGEAAFERLADRAGHRRASASQPRHRSERGPSGLRSRRHRRAVHPATGPGRPGQGPCGLILRHGAPEAPPASFPEGDLPEVGQRRKVAFRVLLHCVPARSGAAPPSWPPAGDPRKGRDGRGQQPQTGGSP